MGCGQREREHSLQLQLAACRLDPANLFLGEHLRPSHAATILRVTLLQGEAIELSWD